MPAFVEVNYLAVFLAGIASMVVGMTAYLMTSFWSWLGFVAPVQFTEVLFSGKSTKLFLINTGYQLASLLAMAIILTMM